MSTDQSQVEIKIGFKDCFQAFLLADVCFGELIRLCEIKSIRIKPKPINPVNPSLDRLIQYECLKRVS